MIPPRLSVPVTITLWLNTVSGNAGTVPVLSLNNRRASLTIANLSTTATLYFGFNGASPLEGGVALGFGKGIIYDVVCPQAALYLYMDAATAQQCAVMEITYL